KTNNRKADKHTGIYERKDLISLINTQKKQTGNRINPEDLELTKKALKLNDKTVGELVHNWSKIERVTAGEAIRPILLDELHKTKQMYIPVVSDADKDVVVGMLDLNHLNITSNSVIGDQMNQNVYFLNEDDNLSVAIKSMADSGSPVFIVRDKDQKPVGLITLKDVVKELTVVTTNTESDQ
ncbi:MAG TPA: CBS domain-containing protein, partial [Candidatus Saccharimonadales bacterium]